MVENNEKSGTKQFDNLTLLCPYSSERRCVFTAASLHNLSSSRICVFAPHFGSYGVGSYYMHIGYQPFMVLVVIVLRIKTSCLLLTQHLYLHSVG